MKIIQSLTLWKYRDLLWMWTSREIKVRYKQSILGALWAILQPLSLMAMFTLVFSVLARFPSEGIPYPIFSYTAVLPWTFFAGSISNATPSLINNMSLVTKIYFPREIIPISSVLASFIDFLVATLVYLGLVIFYQVPISVTVFLVPVLLTIQILLTVGIVLISSALTVFYRDIRFVVPLAVQIWLYATPIIYPLALVPEKFRPFYLLNPMAGLIESYRAVILKGLWPDWNYLGIAAAVSIIVFYLGFHYFKRIEWQFADII